MNVMTKEAPAGVGARITGLDHINICTKDLAASERFYAETFGLEGRDAIGPVGPDQARWMCDAEGQPVIHLYRGEPIPGRTGAIQHFAFKCHDKEAMLARIEASGAKVDVYDGLPGVTLMFVQDPHGIVVELNFAEG